MTTTDKNKLIAEFMGYEIQKDPTERFFGRYKAPITGIWLKENELGFNSSYDWIMPVVDSILCLDGGIYNTIITSNQCRIYSDNKSLDILASENSTISAIYNAVVEFIQWYNLNKEEK